MRMTMIMSMQILHIMVMSVYLCIQDYIEITGINPGFRHPAYFYLKSLHRNTFKYILQHLLICSQIQQCCHCHITTDSGITLQNSPRYKFIKLLFNLCLLLTKRQPVHLRCQISGSISIVNIHGGNSIGTGIDHGQKC